MPVYHEDPADSLGLLAALAATGETTLRDVYMINRGYEDLPTRLNALGASISVFTE